MSQIQLASKQPTILMQLWSLIQYQSCFVMSNSFPSIRHNEVRDITASLPSEVFHGVSIEPHLQPLSGETMSFRSANTDGNSRLDIAAYGFWGSRFERAFFDVRVFNPCARSNRQTSLQSTYRRHEQEKKRQCGIREVQH